MQPDAHLSSCNAPPCSCAQGGEVVEGRVEGNLNLSRAVGDLLYKRNRAVGVEAQMITALPDVVRDK